MIQSPDGTCICDECILYCTDVLARGGYLNGRHPSQGNMPDSFDGDFDGYEGHIAQAPFDDEEQAPLRRPRFSPRCPHRMSFSIA